MRPPCLHGGSLAQMTRALQAARRARGWSQARAAWELTRFAESRGMKVASSASLKTQLSRWENGHVTPSYYRELLCDFYEILPAEFEIDIQQQAPPPAEDVGGAPGLTPDVAR